MNHSRIDGRGLLPYTCKHRNGYNGGHDGRICWECAEGRAIELESIIAVLGEAVRAAVQGIDAKRPQALIQDSLITALLTARAYFDKRALDSNPDLGGWLND